MAENDLLITIDASTDGLRRGVSQAEKVVTQFGQRTEASLRQIDGTMKKVDGSFKVLDRGSTGFARFGGAAQQAGYQIGDFAVQVASGQNAVVALTQQLSQLLGAFGTAGAVIGAGAAIAGALATKLIDTRSASERFEDGLKRLADQLKISNNLLEETETGLTEVGDAFLRADEFGRRLIKSNLEESIRKQSQAIRDQAAAIKELTAEQELFSTISGPGGRPSTAIGILSPTDGLSKDQGFRISEAMRAFEQSDGGLRAAKEFAQALIDMRAELNGASPAFTAFADQLLSAVQESIKAGEATESLKEQLASLGREVPKNTAAVKEFEKASTAFAAAMDRLRTSAQGVIESYDPLAAAQSRAFEKLTILGDAAVAGAISWDEYAKATANVRAELKRAEDPLGTVLNGLKAELEMLKKSEDAREKATRVQAAYNEAVKNGAPAIEATRKAIEAEVDKILEQERANASAKKVRDEAAALAKKQADEEKALADRRIETIEDLQSEVRFLADLREAHLEGADAVRRVEEAREAELLVQRLKLGQDDIEVGLIDELIRKRGEHRAAIEAITDAQNEAERAARKLADEQKKAAEDAARAYEKVIDDIARNSQEKLGDAIFDHLKGETVDFAQFLKDTLLRAIADIAAAALTQQIVIPIATQVVGAVPGLFGLSGQAAGVARGQAGGGLFGSGNPLSSLTNLIPTDGLYNSFAMSGLGQSLGLSYGAGTLATAPGMFFAGGAVPGAIAASPALTLAATGPAGGFGTLAGISTASTGGAVGAATAGGSLAASGGLTGLGAGLGAALPYIGAAIAIASIFGPMLFGGNPSVGPVGIADFSPGLGRRGAFDVPGITPFTSDNGGNAEGLRPIAEAIADLIADSADRFSATIEQSLRFRVANYQSPESGSGRQQGFEVNAFIRGEAEKRVAEGLSQEQAIFEAFRYAVKEAFKFDSATLAEAAANTAATTTEELLSDLEFADHFDRLNTALDDLGGMVDANTLALAQSTVAAQDAARTWAEQNAQPITDSLSKALELFPAEVTKQVSGPKSVKSVLVGTVGEDERYLNPGDEGYDAALAAPGARVLDRIVGISEQVTATADNYADNLDRVGQAVDIATGSIDLLVQQITGEFEPSLKGPFATALETGNARLDALKGTISDVNDQIEAANEAFPGLNAALIDVNQTITDAQAALLANLQDDFRQSVADALDPAGAKRRAFVDAATPQLTDAVALGLGGDEPLMRDLFRAFSEGAQAAGLGIQDIVGALDDLRIAAGDAGVTVTQLVDGTLAELRQDFRQQLEDAANPDEARVRGLVDAANSTITDAVALGLGGDQSVLSDIVDVFTNQLAGAPIADLADALLRLQESAADAGVAVSGLIDGALNDLRDSFGSSIQAQTNAATGLGAINVLQGLADTRDINLADAAALGIEFPQDGSNPVLDLFNAQVKQALSGLSFDQINQLLASGQITDQGTLNAITAALADETLPAFQAAIQASIQSIDAEIAERQSSVDALKNAIEGLRQGRIGRAINPEVSIFDPQEQFRIAMEEFNRVSAAAQGGDLSAIARFDDVADATLQSALAAFGRSDSRFAAVFNQIQSDSLKSTDLATTQLSIAQSQLDELKAIREALGGKGGEQDFGARPTRNRILASLTGYTGDFGAGGFQGFLQTSGLPQSVLDAVNQVVSTVDFATGGIMTSHGPLPLHRYATGGIADMPQVALFGEGRMPEAFVPLPDGRSIPVTVRGTGANDNMLAGRLDRVADLLDASIRTNGAGNEELVGEVKALRGDIRRLSDRMELLAS